MSSVQGIKRTLALIESKLQQDELRAHLFVAHKENEIEGEVIKWQDSQTGTHYLYVLPLYSFSVTNERRKSAITDRNKHMSALGLLN